MRFKPFVLLTIWSLAGLILFGLLELFFSLTVSVVNPYGGGSGALISIINFIFTSLIILSVLGLLIGIAGLIFYYFFYEEGDNDSF